MAQRVKRRPKKKNEMTYKDLEKALAGRDINNLTEKDYTELEKLGFGGWMKRNWGNVAQTAGGIGAMFIPGGQAIGASLMSSGVTGMAGDAKEQSALKEQDAQTTEMEASTNANNELQNKLQQNPLQNYGVTMRRGGKLRKYQVGGNVGDPPPGYITKEKVDISTEGWEPEEAALIQKGELSTHTSLPSGTIQRVHKMPGKRYVNPSTGQSGLHYNIDFHVRENGKTFNRSMVVPEKVYKNIQADPKVAREDLRGFNPNYILDTYKDDVYLPYLESKRDGGRLSKYRGGGTINYEGQLHEGPNGGIPVDAQGNPDTANPIALTEGKEVTHNGYVFSDTLKYDNDETFAEKIKEEQNKYKLRGKTKGGIFKIHDPYDKVGYEKTVSKMKEQQETLKSVLQPEQEMQELPMARRGGTLPKYSGTYPHSSFLNKEQSPFNIGTQGAYNASRDIFNASLQDSYGYNPYFKTSSPNFGEGVGTGQDFDIQGSNKFSSPTGTEPYQGMNWAQAGVAAAAPVIGSTIGIIQELRNRESNRPSRLNFDRVIPQQISLEEQRSGIRGQGAVARAGTRRGLRGGATSYGQYAGNVGAAEAGISRNVAGGLSESYLSEQLNNAKMRERADRLNAEMDMQEELYNSRIQNQYDAASRGRVNQYISQGLSGITGAIGQKFQSERDADYLNMLNPNYEFVQAPTGRWMTDTFNPKRRMVPRNYGI